MFSCWGFLKRKKEVDPFEITKELKTWTEDFTLREIKVSVKTHNKNFVLLLKDKISSYENLEADLGRGMSTKDPRYATYKEKCIKIHAKDYILEQDSNDGQLSWLLKLPGTEGPAYLNDRDSEMKHSVRRQDIESVRVVWIKKTEIKLRKYSITDKENL